MSEVYHIRAGNRNVVIRCTNTFITGTILASRVKKKTQNAFKTMNMQHQHALAPPAPTHTHTILILYLKCKMHMHTVIICMTTMLNIN